MLIQPTIWVECLTKTRQSAFRACFRAGLNAPVLLVPAPAAANPAPDRTGQQRGHVIVRVVARPSNFGVRAYPLSCGAVEPGNRRRANHLTFSPRSGSKWFPCGIGNPMSTTRLMQDLADKKATSVIAVAHLAAVASMMHALPVKRAD